jgi:hypothetical protein
MAEEPQAAPGARAAASVVGASRWAPKKKDYETGALTFCHPSCGPCSKRDAALLSVHLLRAGRVVGSQRGHVGAARVRFRVCAVGCAYVTLSLLSARLLLVLRGARRSCARARLMVLACGSRRSGRWRRGWCGADRNQGQHGAAGQGRGALYLPAVHHRSGPGLRGRPSRHAGTDLNEII